MNHFGNAFVPCGVVYYIDTYNAQSTTINFAYECQNWAYMEPQHSVHQSVRLQLHGGLQPQWKSAVRLGQQAFGQLSYHFWTTKVKRKLHQPKTAPKLNAFLSTEQKTECN